MHAVADFLEAIHKGEGITPDFADGVRIMKVLEAALHSMEQGGRVEL